MFNFENLDSKTREFMILAIEVAEKTNNIYYSTRFNSNGSQKWVPLLKEAAKQYNEHWLAYQLEANVLMKDFEGAQTPSGGYTIKHVPHTAAETMAEGQFNRFYILGLCKRANAEGITHLEIYRAKNVSEPRPESQALIGTKLSIAEIESQLKVTNNSFKSPLVKPNSGLTVRIPK
jgi:hypothetical protein